MLKAILYIILQFFELQKKKRKKERKKHPYEQNR